MMKLKMLPLAMSVFFISVSSYGETLADFHKSQGHNCQSCHTKPVKVDDAETHENKSCEGCHGTLAELTEKSKKKLTPHHSHLIDLSCTSCHSGHNQPVLVCQACHDTFKTESKIPFSNDAPVLDNYQYASVTQEMIDKALAIGPTEQHQLIIIGAGAAGHASAVSARQNGVKDVIILEKQSYIGGNGMLAAGGMSAAQSLTQATKGYNDSKESWYQDTMKGGRNINNPELVRTLTENGSAGVDWLQAMGADLSSAARAGGHNAERLHRPDGGAKSGPEIIRTLKDTAKKLGVETRLNSKVIQLVQDKEGRITGVLVQGKHSKLHVLGAKAVIIASGGFARNNELVAKYRPDLKGVDATNNPGNVGDALTFATKVGAATVDIKEIQAFPTAAAGKMVISETARGAGAIMLNNQGKRFCNELDTRDKVSACVWSQTNKEAWLVFDETVLDRLGQLRGMLDLGLIFKGGTASEISKLSGMDAQSFEQSINRYNDFKVKGNDDDFGRKNMADDIKYPIYVVKVKPAVHHTMGGLKINTKAQVLNDKDQPIDGLYAAGEVTGGVHGANRLAGNAIADTIVFGRIAGEQVANKIK